MSKTLSPPSTVLPLTSTSTTPSNVLEEQGDPLYSRPSLDLESCVVSEQVVLSGTALTLIPKYQMAADLCLV